MKSYKHLILNLFMFSFLNCCEITFLAKTDLTSSDEQILIDIQSDLKGLSESVILLSKHIDSEDRILNQYYISYEQNLSKNISTVSEILNKIGIKFDEETTKKEYLLKKFRGSNCKDTKKSVINETTANKKSNASWIKNIRDELETDGRSQNEILFDQFFEHANKGILETIDFLNEKKIIIDDFLLSAENKIVMIKKKYMKNKLEHSEQLDTINDVLLKIDEYFYKFGILLENCNKFRFKLKSKYDFIKDKFVKSKYSFLNAKEKCEKFVKDLC